MHFWRLKFKLGFTVVRKAANSRGDEETPFSYAAARASQQDGGKLAGYVARLTFPARRTGARAS